MTDVLRVAVFVLSLSAVLASSLMFVSSLRLSATASALALWVIGTGQVVLIAEALSLLHALDWPGFLLGQAIVLGVATAWTWRLPAADRWRAAGELGLALRGLAPIAWSWRVPALPILAGATLLTGLISTALALWVPPNNFDSLAYHMSRVGYYLQFRSLEHYPRADFRQVTFPVNAEILILWTVAFLRSDRLAATIQLAAYVVSAVAVYGLARQVGFRPEAAVFGACTFALLPIVVVESTSTQNDLVAAAFLLASLFFILQAAEAPRPTSRLALAGAAAGLALGTKGTAFLALPGLAAVFAFLFRRRLTRDVVAGLLFGASAALLLGAYFYVQNWYMYAPAWGPRFMVQRPVVTWEGFVSVLARNLYTLVFADLSGLPAAPGLVPIVAPAVQVLASVGHRLFDALSIPGNVEGVDIPGRRSFTFDRPPTVSEEVSAGGPVGGLIFVLAAIALVWPGRLPRGRRLLAVLTISYMILMSLTLRVTPSGGRYMIAAFAASAPLLGVVLQRPRIQHQLLALVLVLYAAASGLFSASFGDNKPLVRLPGRDRLGLFSLKQPQLETYYRTIDRELGTSGVLGVYATAEAWEYPFFGPRFARTLLPLVPPEYALQAGLTRPSSWTNESLLARYRPEYIATVSPARPGSAQIWDVFPGRCTEVPVEALPLAQTYQLWRCQYSDRGSVVENGDFRSWGGSPLTVLSGSGDREIADNWTATVSGDATLQVARIDNDSSSSDPFSIRLDYQAASQSEAGLLQRVPALDQVRGLVVVVNARVYANRVGAALLRVEDGVADSVATSQTTGWETLHLEHFVDQNASQLTIGLYASAAGQDATVVARSIKAIPFAPSDAFAPVSSPRARPGIRREIVDADDGLSLGSGWYPAETAGDETFRWVNNDAEIIVRSSSVTSEELIMLLEAGPGVASKPFTLQLLNSTNMPVASTEITGRQAVQLRLPLTQGSAQRFRLHVDGGGLLSPGDTRVLNFRVFKIGRAASSGFFDPVTLRALNENSDIGPTADLHSLYTQSVLPRDGLFVGSGWYPLESFAGQTFRWVDQDAQIVVTEPSGIRQRLRLELEPGPGAGSKPFALQVLDERGQVAEIAQINGRQIAQLSLPIVAGETAVFRLHVEGGGLPTPNDPRTLNFRVFAFDWE